MAALLLIVPACAREEPLTAARAEQIVRTWSFRSEPVYAEVPRRVWWTPESPMDAYDVLAVRTLENLEGAGLVSVTRETADGSATYVAAVTQKGFPILGTAPSVRGPVYRTKICDKVYEGLRNFERHPTESSVGHGELVWRYANPTPFYEMFETKMDKPLGVPFASHISFWFEGGQWKFGMTVEKADAANGEPTAGQLRDP